MEKQGVVNDETPEAELGQPKTAADHCGCGHGGCQGRRKAPNTAEKMADAASIRADRAAGKK